MKIMVLILVICSILLTSCTTQTSVEQKQVLKCANLIFKCSDNDCANQCGVLMSKNNEKVLTGLSVNNGKGCECTYVKYG
jgi:hypothetical protein